MQTKLVITVIAAAMQWSSAWAQSNTQTEPVPAALTQDDVLSVKDGHFHLDGRPFAEISFNKYDLLWQLYDQLATGKTLADDNPAVQAQDKALRNLHETGFQSIRVFGLPWGPSGPESYSDPEKRGKLYAAIDKTLDLCDRHHIRLVWSLGAGTFTDTKLVQGKGWVFGEEQPRELMANRDSRGRQLLYRYLDETVSRYKNRKTILMWEISNELTLDADIGDKNGIFEGQRVATLKEVALFSDDVAKRIKANDPLRLVNNGGSCMREHQWHLYQRKGWVRDTFEEQFKCVEMVFANSAVDVIDIHYYPGNRRGYAIMGEDGKETFLDIKGYKAMAERLRKPLMIGEFGFAPAAKTDRKIWEANPDYFESFADTAAARPWVEHALGCVVDAGVQLSYWWCYQSEKPANKSNPQRYDLERERNPELLKSFIDANQRLRAKLGVESTR